MANSVMNCGTIPSWFVFLLSIMPCMQLLAATWAVGAPHEICVTDDSSRQVCLPRACQRVVSFAPSLTEIVFLSAPPISWWGKLNAATTPGKRRRYRMSART